MENYIVSARKYRPQTFDTVVGQQSVTNTLKNAIKTGHLAQAFLFSGPRGVGKTTCARILAKTINCQNLQENIEACNQCESCTSFNEGHSLNIFELDAASNNSVDDIRSLIDQVRFAPQLGTKKVYIIDEVHMLSQAAFNAFLKTLEEPPPHAVFILATTEKHKIIPTILSRCQIFDFKRITVSDIANHLQQIAQKENIQAEEEALHIIAEKADGALRDALSIFDQIVTFCGSNITYQDVIKNLNILDYEYYFKITEANLLSDNAQVLLLLNEILLKGFDGHNFIVGLAEHYRNLLILKNPQTVQLLETSEKIKQRYLQQAEKTPEKFLLNAIEFCSQADREYKQAKNQRLLIEITLLKINAIIKKIQKKKSLNNQKAADTPSLDRQSNSEKSNKTADTYVTVQPTKSEVSEPDEKNHQYSTNSPVNKTESPEPQKKIVPSVLATTGSIKDILKKTTKNKKEQKEAAEVDKQIADKEPVITNPFSQEQLNECWSSFQHHLKNITQKESILSLFRLHQPQLEENYRITIMLDNAFQKQLFKEIQPEFLQYFKKHLKNNQIQVGIKISPNASPQKAYTELEKFKKMVEINPNLLKLKEKLDLDLN